MPESKVRVPSLGAVPRSALRVVLFGMPQAGKSSLLGALAEAAQTQEHLLNGHLSDISGGLAEMQQRLYETGQRETLEEVLPFPIMFEPFAARSAGRTQAVLIDCDGRVANDLLTQRRELDASRASNALGWAVLRTDALIFAVDASATTPQIDSELTECVRFLHLLEERRGQRTEVGGLPVFLVLTKCDLLARPDDDLSAWIEKIEERKRQVGKRFEEFLLQERQRSALPFGSVQLNVWATAVRRPALAGTPVRAREPYGVAELFRRCLASARVFRERRGRSTRRLLVTALVALVAIAVLAALPLLLLRDRARTPPAGDLGLRVARYRARAEALAPAARFDQPRTRIGELTAFRDDPEFDEQPAAVQEFILKELAELKAYDAFAKQVDALPDPRVARNETDLRLVRESAAELTKSSEFRPEWKPSEAGLRLSECLEEVQALEKAVQTVSSGYERVTQDAKQVLADANKAQLPTRALRVLEEARQLPEPRLDANKRIPGSDHVTYAAVFGFDRVHDTFREWEKLRVKLDSAARLKEP